MEQKKIIFFLAVLIFAVNIFFYSRIKNDSPVLKEIKDEKTKILIDSTEVYKNSSLKYVLFFTNFWRNKYWHIGKETVGSEHHHFDTCSVKNCIFTNKKRYLKNYEDYDALIFHNGEGWKVKGKFCYIPEVRKPNQLYIIAVQEPPLRTPTFRKFVSNFYNLTMTYHLNSDIFFGYGGIDDISSGKRVSPARNIIWKKPTENFTDPRLFEIVKSKTKNLIWVASNCIYFRKKLVRKLQEHIDIDTFGKCGSTKCTSSECNIMFNSTYKFYLSFENSICPDYVTEKLFKILDYNIIPVVLNGANMADFLPPKSYIDANSFKSVKELADYLKFLSNNTEEYMKYFWWKEHYQTWKGRVNLCKICEKINDEKVLSEGRTVENFSHFHSPYKCKKPKIN